MLLPIIAVCFLLSGAASLPYEIVWAKYLALFLGSDAHAVTAVLSTFMGGLAIGNFFLARLADRLPRPLLLFGFLEMAIGGYALLFLRFYQPCHSAYVALARGSPTVGSTLAIKLVVSMLMVLPPTILMGATLPALAKALTGSLRELDLRVSALYALNSAGAVIGCWVTDFWWIPSMGLPASARATTAPYTIPWSGW